MTVSKSDYYSISWVYKSVRVAPTRTLSNDLSSLLGIYESDGTDKALWCNFLHNIGHLQSIDQMCATPTTSNASISLTHLLSTLWHKRMAETYGAVPADSSRLQNTSKHLQDLLPATHANITLIYMAIK